MFRWTEKSERVAFLASQGKFTQEQIGEQAGVSERTVCRWLAMPEFQTRVDEHVGHFGTELRRISLENARRNAAEVSKVQRKRYQRREKCPVMP